MFEVLDFGLFLKKTIWITTNKKKFHIGTKQGLKAKSTREIGPKTRNTNVLHLFCF